MPGAQVDNERKKRVSIFRRSKALSPSPESTILLTPDGKKARFSLFRNSSRRSGVVLHPALFPKPKPSSPTPSSSSSSEESSDAPAGTNDSEQADERSRALSILEGRAAQPAPTPESGSPSLGGEGGTREDTGTTTPSSATVPVPASFIGALSMAVASGRSRPGSVGSRRSLSNDGRRASSRLGLVPENSTVTTARDGEVDEHGLPTYASAAYPNLPATYRFAQAGPFAMTLGGDDEEVSGMGRYHVSVGVNVWAPKSCVTTVRRGLGEDGPVVAHIESGCAAMMPTVTIGEVTKSLKDVMSKNLVNGSRMYYVGDGSAIYWKLSRTEWKAYYDSAHLATFSPLPPRTITVLPLAHRFMDHLLIAILLLMREKDDSGYARPEYGIVSITPFM